MNSEARAPDSAPTGSGDGSGAVIRAKFRPSRAVLASVKRKPVTEAPPPPPPRLARSERLARQLALAHWIERAIEAGQFRCYADVSRLLGLSASRIEQIAALLGLSPALQERVLLGEGGLGIRAAIRAAREVDWDRQGQ